MPLYHCMCLHFAPQAMEPTTAQLNKKVDVCHEAIGAKALRVAGRQLVLLGVCSVFVVGSDEGLTAVPYSNDGLHTIQFWE